MPEERRERDLILSPNEFAFISDQTKGNINVYVGPYKASLSNTDQPIIFDSSIKTFDKCNLENSIQTFAIAPEGWYLTLKNPAKDNSYPKTGTVNNMVELNVGHKVSIPGPVSFPLWPGQMVNVIKGHYLRSNQYLVVRVYDEKSAQENWEKAVIKSQSDGTETQGIDVSKLSLGKQLIIKGTDVSFYIPPTGIEVVKDEKSEYIRKAVTLERLEYCILLDENGNKRFVRGPEVVFPEPTESFIETDGKRKFKAIELSEIKGIYIKVIAPYSEDGKEYKEGDELFLTGKDMMIYFPRQEHAIIKYGENEIHYAVAIPEGEARYVMNRLTGDVFLRKGPDMFLPDPRKEVIVKRILDNKQVDLWFPGNQKAKEINEQLKKELKRYQKKTASIAPQLPVEELEDLAFDAFMQEEAAEGFSGDSFDRRTQYTPPRTITLDTKYEGAVAINVWSGYAIMVVGKTGERKVIVGPKTYLLEYDEELQVFSLSCDNPKTDKKLLKDVYLRILNNKVSDMVEVETKDFVRLDLKLSYRLNFQDDSNKWFNVENYVKFLTDRFRSILSMVVKTYSINEFYTNSFTILKKAIMGEDLKTGYLFSENNMFVYDVEIVSVSIKDNKIAQLLMEAQQSLIQESAILMKEKSKLEITKFLESIKQQTAEVQYETNKSIFGYEKDELEKKVDLEVAKIDSDKKTNELKLEGEIKEEELLSKINELKLQREKQTNEQGIYFKEKEYELYVKEIEVELKAVVEKAKAISPDLIAALQAFADKELLQKVASSMAPLSILGGESVADVFAKLLKGTKLEGVFLNIGSDAVGKIIKKTKE